MKEVPPEVWITGQSISLASAFDRFPGPRDVCTRVPDQQDRLLGRVLISSAASATICALAPWLTRR